MDFDTRICMALMNREITHSSFRIYAALVMALDGETGDKFTEIDVDALKKTVPGVMGKPLGEGPLRECLRDLQYLGLIETTGRKWSKFRIHVKLTSLEPNPGLPGELKSKIVVPEERAWGPDSWRSAR